MGFQPCQKNAPGDDPNSILPFKLGERMADRFNGEAEKISDILTPHWPRQVFWLDQLLISGLEPQHVDCVRVPAILHIVRCSSAGRELLMALALMRTERTDALHVAQ